MIHLDDKYLSIVKTILLTIIPDFEVWLFGSRITGHVKPFSDIDLAIIAPDFFEMQLQAELSLAFDESDLPFKVDILDFKQADPDFQKLVFDKHVVIQKGSG